MGNFLNLVYDGIDVSEQDIINYFGTYVGENNKLNFNFKVFEINEIPSDGNKYYYFYEYRYYLAPLIVSNQTLPFNEKVINLLKNNPDFYVIIKNDAESDDDNLIESLDTLLKNIGIETKKFVVINCNERNDDLKLRLNSDLITHTTNNGKFAIANELTRFPYNFKKERNFLFMSYNRKVKNHRFALLVYLMYHNVLYETDWSWMRGYELKEQFLNSGSFQHFIPSLNQFFTKNEIFKFEKEILALIDIEIKKSPYEKDYQVDYPPHTFDTEASYSNNPYKNSYINIVTETNFDKNDIIILSEKSFIPLYFSQIPIIMASTNHIKKMKDRYGFDFFEDVVDHSYDSEPNYKKRFEMIIDEVLRLNTKKQEIISFFKNNKTRFDKNIEIFNEIKKDKADFNFYNSLI